MAVGCPVAGAGQSRLPPPHVGRHAQEERRVGSLGVPESRHSLRPRPRALGPLLPSAALEGAPECRARC